jgi:hypothetical protein
MRKNIVVFAKMVTKFYDGDLSPYEILILISRHEGLKFLIKMLNSRELLVVCFLVPLIKSGEYIKGHEHIINNYLFSFMEIHFGELSDEMSCPDCYGDGYISCSECNGTGYVECGNCDGSGNETCPDCSGDGEDSEGEMCGNCEGEGTLVCNDCGGHGQESCQYCDDGTYSCHECNGTGKITTDEHIPFVTIEYYSYNPKLREKIKELYNSKEPLTKDIPKMFLFKLYTSEYDHNDRETKDIDIEYQNSVRIGSIDENPTISYSSGDRFHSTLDLDIERFEE